MTGREFEGRVALVSGAAGDIGVAAARAFAAAGAAVVLTDRRDGMEQVAAELRAGGSTVLVHAADQTDPTAVAALYDAVAQEFGRLDAAFLNAGYGRDCLLIDMPYDQWRRHIDINLNGGFLMAQGAARAMVAAGNGGAIVFNASTAAAHVSDLLGAYASAKAGLRMLSKSLASELGAHRIRVNLIMPGVIETAMTRSMLENAAVHASVVSHTPVGRIGQPEDIANLAAFLCSDRAGFINAAEIVADGGQTLHGGARYVAADYAIPGAPWLPAV